MLPKVAEKPEQGPGEYYIWSIPDKPVSIHLNLATVRVLTSSAGAGLGTLPRRGLEVGGLLLGRVVHPNPDQYIVSIEKTEPVEIEHVRGPSYILSATDREELFRLVRKYDKKPNKGLAVVGYYRSHTRPGLYLDEYDFDLMRSYFAHPSSVALLLRPVHEGPAKAGFFIWEDGEIHRACTYREFPLDADLLNPHRPVERLDASAPMVSPLPEQTPRAPCPVIPIARPASDVAAAVAAIGDGVSTVGSAPESAAAAQKGITPRAKRYLTWTAAAAGFFVVAAALWQPLARSRSERPHNLLALNAEPTQTGLRLTWDRGNPLLRGKSSATLFITDGDTEKKIALDAAQLRNGSIIYWPASQDVNFRMQVGDFSESLRALAPKMPPGAESQATVAAAQASQTATVPVVNAGSQQTSPRPPIRARQREIRAAILPRQPDRRPVRSHEFVPPPSAELAAAPVRLDAPAVTERSATRPPAARIAADIEQVRGNGFKRVMSAIFGKGQDDGAFVPARAVRQVPPRLPGNLKIPADTRVSVKVALDETGRVKGTDLVSRNVDARLANAAMEAARRWRFEPARQNDKKIGSSVILHFRFNEHSGG